MKKISSKIKRKLRNRKKLRKVNNGRYRISVSKTLNNLSAQIIDDQQRKTLVSASSIEKTLKSKKIKPASKKEIQSMLSLCVKNLDEINFFRPNEKRPKMLENLRNIFYKMDLSDKETRILSGVFGSLGKKR